MSMKWEAIKFEIGDLVIVNEQEVSFIQFPVEGLVGRIMGYQEDESTDIAYKIKWESSDVDCKWWDRELIGFNGSNRKLSTIVLNNY